MQHYSQNAIVSNSNPVQAVGVAPVGPILRGTLTAGTFLFPTIGPGVLLRLTARTGPGWVTFSGTDSFTIELAQDVPGFVHLVVIPSAFIVGTATPLDFALVSGLSTVIPFLSSGTIWDEYIARAASMTDVGSRPTRILK